MSNERSTQVIEGRTADRSVFLLCAAACAVLALVALLVLSFAGSATQVFPRQVPIAVTGGDQASAAVSQKLDAQVPGGFAVIGVPDAAAAESLIRDRGVYGALVNDGPAVREVLVGSAASPAVAQLLIGLADRLGGVPVRDVAPMPAGDPRGGGLAGGALPITIAGILAGVLALLMTGRAEIRVATTACVAVGSGLVVVAVLHGVFGSLTGNFWLEWAAVTSGVGGIGLAVLAAYCAAGRAGMVALDLILILIGNPFSGVTSAPELLPQPWSWLGHWMPLGSTVDILRGVSGFDGAGVLAPWAGLLGWVVASLGLIALTEMRRRRGLASAHSPL